MNKKETNNTPKTIKQVYDIASAFIIDKDTDLKSHSDNWCVVYTISKTLSTTNQTYHLQVNIPRNIPKKIKNHGSLVLYYLQENQKHILFKGRTKHTVGQILRDYTHPTHSYDLSIIIEKILSYRFYSLIKLIEKRTTAQLKRQDKTNEILEHIIKLTELQR